MIVCMKTEPVLAVIEGGCLVVDKNIINFTDLAQHDCRYLIGSEKNEPQLEWNKEMHGLFQDAALPKWVEEERT